MANRAVFEEKCPARGVIDLLKGKFVIEILAEILAGRNHFGQLLRSVDGINSRILSKRLHEFEQAGLLTKIVLVAEAPRSIEYQLTSKGLALREVVEAMKAWRVEFGE